jgi:hypothetical protein
MAKENQFGIKEVVNMPKKRNLKGSAIIEPLEIEQATRKIENGDKQKILRLSIDIEESTYQKLKIRQFTKGFKTTREYVLDLVHNDLMPE